MTTATATAPEPHLAEGQASYELAALELLFEAPYNARTSFEDLEELTASIRTDGVLEPLLVRDRPTKKRRAGATGDEGQLEIIAGARRARAAKAAGLDVVPVIRLDVGDATARRICAAENLQRAELHPLEEARAIANLVEDFGAAAAAEQLGKTVRYVARRANLLDLSPKWQKAIARPKAAASSYPASILELVALVGQKDQDELLEQLGGARSGNVPGLGYVEREVAECLRFLKRATWKLDDPDLVPKQGACVDCSRHSLASVGLFDDQVAGKLAAATCRDLPCWREKTFAVASRKLAAAREEHGPKLLLIAGGWDGSRHGHRVKNPLGKPALQHYEYRPAKKSTRGAVPAFVVEGKGTGTVRWISKGSSRARTTTKPAAKKVEPGSAEDLKAKRARLQRRRDGFSVDWIRELVEETEAEPRPLAELAPLFLAYGVPQTLGSGYGFKGKKKTAEAYAVGNLWVALRGPIVTAITRHSADALADQVRESRWLVEMLWPVVAKRTLERLAVLAAEKIPKPKGLVALERRGTKKAAPKKKVAKKATGKKKASARGPRAAKKKTSKKRARRRARKD